MLTYNLQQKHKYYSLYKNIRGDILSGKLKCGEKLPSKRSLAENLSVSVITVQTAYDQLLAEGYIESKERSGYFVSKVEVTVAEPHVFTEEKPKKKQEFALDLVKGSAPASLFPFSVWAKLTRKVLQDCGEHLLERVPCDGDFELKSAICGYLYRARGISVSPKYIVIGAGAEYLYGVIVQLLGRDKVFAVENPGYSKIASAYNLNGAKCAFVSVKESGVCCDEVEKSGANVLHISPSHQFPTGAVTPAASRSRIIIWAKQRGAYIVEDDYDSEFRLSGKPLQSLYSLCSERVIYLNTFSKTLAPSMRLGYMVLPPALYEKYIKIFGHSASVVPLFEQKTLAKLIDGGYFERHINRLKTHYKGVREKLLQSIKAYDNSAKIFDTGSGLHFTVKFKNTGDEEVKNKAIALNIRVKCLSDYLFAPIENCENTAVINYSGVTEDALERLRR